MTLIKELSSFWTFNSANASKTLKLFYLLPGGKEQSNNSSDSKKVVYESKDGALSISIRIGNESSNSPSTTSSGLFSVGTQLRKPEKHNNIK